MTRTISSILLVAALILTLYGCGSKGTVVRADDYDAETIVDYMNEEEPLVSEQSLRQAKPNHKAHIPHGVSNSPVEGEWTIIEAAGKVIDRDNDIPYVIFSDKEHRFYASNGCNLINGDFVYGKDGVITFSNVVMTMKSCPDIELQNDISIVFNDGVAVKAKIEKRDRESYMTLYSKSNDLLLRLRRHNLEVINGQWEVEEIGDLPVDGSKVNLFFDIPERSVHGNTGCNYFNGVIVIDANRPSSISFAQMGVTMRMCENADTERRLLVALEETETYTLDGNTLYLNGPDGLRLITLIRSH